MGIRFKFGVEGKKPLGVIANLGTSIKRAADVLLPASRESLSKDMLISNCLPYQALKTYRKIMTESDYRRVQNIVEVRRSLNHVS